MRHCILGSGTFRHRRCPAPKRRRRNGPPPAFMVTMHWKWHCIKGHSVFHCIEGDNAFMVPMHWKWQCIESHSAFPCIEGDMALGTACHGDTYVDNNGQAITGHGMPAQLNLSLLEREPKTRPPNKKCIYMRGKPMNSKRIIWLIRIITIWFKPFF